MKYYFRPDIYSHFGAWKHLIMLAWRKLNVFLLPVLRHQLGKGGTMKKTIILKSPLILSFDWSKSRRALAPETCACSASKNMLDRPPDGDTLLKGFGPKNGLGVVGSRPNHAQRILVVEDEGNLRQFYLNVLTRAGYLVNAAEDGEAGWQALHAAGFSSRSYDLLITDNKMPRLSGVELIRKVHSVGMSLPIILASGVMPPEADRLHLAAILPKPFFMEELLQVIQKVLSAVHDE